MANPTTHPAVADIAISLIDVLGGRRRIDPKWVETLADLFASQGQLSPIEVIAEGERYRLVFGHHRLQAAAGLNWGTIAAVVKDAAAFATQAEITLREITENLARRELSVLDRAVDIARWREVYEATLAVRKAGRPKRLDPAEITDRFVSNFSAAASAALDLTERSIFRLLKIASIPASLRERIALLPVADNQSDLLLLASQGPDRQEAIVDILNDELTDATERAISVAAAIAILDRTPQPPKAKVWEKVSGAFSKMTRDDQAHFYEMHEEGFLLWREGRGRQ